MQCTGRPRRRVARRLAQVEAGSRPTGRDMTDRPFVGRAGTPDRQMRSQPVRARPRRPRSDPDRWMGQWMQEYRRGANRNRLRMASTATRAAPRTMPSQPACAMPIAPRTGSYSITGTQSAKRMYNVTRGLRVRITSAFWCRTSLGRGASAMTTSAECTCQTSNMDSSGRPTTAKDRSRFSRT